MVGRAARAARRSTLQRFDDETEEHGPAEQGRLSDDVEDTGVNERGAAAHEARADQRGLVRSPPSLLRPIPVELGREVLAVELGEVAQILGLEPTDVSGADQRGDLREEHLLQWAGRYPPSHGIGEAVGRHDGGGIGRARYDARRGLHGGVLLPGDDRERDIRGGHVGLAVLGGHPRRCATTLSGATAGKTWEKKLRDDERLAVERGRAMTWRGLRDLQKTLGRKSRGYVFGSLFDPSDRTNELRRSCRVARDPPFARVAPGSRPGRATARCRLLGRPLGAEHQDK